MITELITSPFCITVFTLMLWALFYNIFYRVIKLKEKSWKRLEYVWLFVGFIGLISVVNDNKRQFSYYQSENSNNYIKFLLSELKSTLNSTQTCFQFIKTEYFPSNFDDLQHDQNLICEWSKSYKLNVDTITDLPKEALQKIQTKQFKFKSDGMDRFIRDFNSSVETINSEIKAYKEHRENYENDIWESLSKSLGVLLISFAFAIRLSIATKNVVQSKG